jgi:hypothetical protein
MENEMENLLQQPTARLKSSIDHYYWWWCIFSGWDAAERSKHAREHG